MAKATNPPPKPEQKPRCGDCQYAVAAFTDHVSCRRYPPVIVVNVGPVTCAPVVPSDYWCGEFKLKS